MSETRDNFKCWDINPLEEVDKIDKNFLYHLVEWAILAPSSHNVQCWRFKIDEVRKSVAVALLKEGVLPASDVCARQAHVSLGCALDGLVIAGECYGLKSKIEIVGRNFYPESIAEVTFEGIPSKKQERGNWLNAIKTRRVNRGKFKPLESVPETILDKIKIAAESLGLKIHFIKDVPTRFAIAEIQYLADKFVIAKDNFRLELGKLFLDNKTDEFIGMPGNTFGLSDEMTIKIITALSKTGPFDPDLAAGFSASGRDGLKSSPVVCVISAPKDDFENWIRVGEALNRSLLIAELNGLSAAMHAAIVEVDFFNKMLRLRLSDMYRPTAIFRLGYKTEDRPHSPRLPAEKVIEYR